MTFAELFQMIDELLRGEYDPYGFSFDFPGEMVASCKELERENSILLDECQQNFPEICAELEDDERLYDEFKRKIYKEYKRVRSACGID